jgi:hypothetical protein
MKKPQMKNLKNFWVDKMDILEKNKKKIIILLNSRINWLVVKFFLILAIFWLIINIIFVHDWWPKILLDFCFALIVTIGVNILESVFSDYTQDRPKAREYMNHVKDNLQLIGITLNDFHLDKDEFIIKTTLEKFSLSSDNSSKEVVYDRIYHKITFQFLLLDPYSIAMKERSKIEKKPINILRLECIKTIKVMDTIIEKLSEKGLLELDRIFQYKFYDFPPAHSVIITDDHLWVGPYLFKKPGTITKWFQIKNFKAQNEYINEFVNIWESNEHSFTKEQLCKKSNEKKLYREIFLIAKYIPSKELDDILLNSEKNSEEILNKKFQELIDKAKIIDQKNIECKDL